MSRESRSFMAGNPKQRRSIGQALRKTPVRRRGIAEKRLPAAAIHATGRYPDWWDGAEFKKHRYCGPGQ